MDEKIIPAPDAPESPAKTPAQLRAEAIKTYHAAKNREEKRKIWEDSPILQEIFSAGNHS